MQLSVTTIRKDYGDIAAVREVRQALNQSASFLPNAPAGQIPGFTRYAALASAH